jgi:hypothetical protein
MLSYHLRLGILTSLSLSDSQTRTYVVFVASHIRAIARPCPASLIHFDLVTLIIVADEYRL